MAFSRRETAILIVGDFLILAASLWAALALRNLAVPSFGFALANLVPFSPLFLISLLVFYIVGLYEKPTRLVRREMGARIFTAQTANVAIAVFFFFVLPLSVAPKTILALYLIVSVAAISAWRLYRARRERVGEVRAKALLVASGAAARETFEEVNGNDRYRFLFTAHLDPAGVSPEDIGRAVEQARARGIEVIVLDTRAAQVAPVLATLYDAMLGGTMFLEFSAFYEDVFDRVPLDHVDHAWLLECLPKKHAAYDIAKRAFDLALGLVALAAAAPFILAAAALLKALGGSAFIASKRVGKGGRLFALVKLRTMLFDDRGDPELHAKNRVTAFGRFLRAARIDELPQLWNVLMGDLSFIGPRPELPTIAAVYEREIPFYQARHAIPPGLSGWAQIRQYDVPKGIADVERTRVKLSYDLYYLERRSFMLDLAIVLKTLRALASFSGT